jgi:hypothetical protein
MGEKTVGRPSSIDLKCLSPLFFRRDVNPHCNLALHFHPNAASPY